MKKLTLISPIILSAFFIACNNGTPQEKAAKEGEKYEEKAFESAQSAQNAAVDADEKNWESIVYSNMAASNEAVARIPMPSLSNDKANNLCKKIGKSIVNRINATDENSVKNAEKDIMQDKTDINNAYIDKKITESDKDAILDYANKCLHAAQNVTL